MDILVSKFNVGRPFAITEVNTKTKTTKTLCAIDETEM